MMNLVLNDGSPDLSENQKLVMDLLERKSGPLSAYMILDELRDSGFRAPLQVYRALEKLISIGKVHRVESLSAFIACSHMSCEKLGVTAFVICDKCENVQEVSDESISLFVTDLAIKTKMKAAKSNIELHGLCDGCQNI
jgi:Fur family zinc uptake transcriptional regulator|tara:strand:+ start:2202 stop:2618 length:417 start_codon:yes stop_codon:yes gene_type:complete